MRYHKIILSLIIFGGFLARVTLLDFPLISEETTRDQLIASHIVKFGEYPLFGPNNGTLPSVGNSPLYYYLVALPYLFSGNPMAPSVFNLMLQVSSLFIFYLITDKLFGKKAALASTTFAAFANVFVITSVWIWQPYLMSFFLLLSIYFLIKAEETGKIPGFVISLCLFVVSMALHMSVFALLPFFAAALIYFALKRKLGVRGFLVIGFAGLAAFLICNTNLISSGFFPGPTTESTSVTQRFVQNSNEYISMFAHNSGIVFSSFGNPLIVVSVPAVLLFMVFSHRKRVLLKIYLLATIVGFLAVSALLNDKLWDQHFYPLFIIFVILLGSSINALEKSRLFTKTVFYIFAGLFLISSSSAKLSITDTVWTKNISLPHFEKLEASNAIGKTLKTEVSRIRELEGFGNNGFFGFRTYTDNENMYYLSQTHLLDSPYWLSIELEMNQKFVSLKNQGMETVYSPPEDTIYIFVACLYYSRKEDETGCLTQFERENPDYKIVDDMNVNHYGHSFYIARDQGRD